MRAVGPTVGWASGSPAGGRVDARRPATGEAAAVLLVDLDGYTIGQAAGILRVHRGTVSRARTRALRKLRTPTPTSCHAADRMVSAETDPAGCRTWREATG